MIAGARLELRADIASPVEHDVALVAIGVVAAQSADDRLAGSLAKLDHLLAGQLERMRRSHAQLGESLLLDGAPGIRAPRVLLVGLGAAGEIGLASLATAARVAVAQALALGAASVGFAPGLRDAGVTALDVADVAAAVASGARAAFAEQAQAKTAAVVFTIEASAEHGEAARAGLNR